MGRLMSLGVLTAVLGGGYAFLNGLSPSEVGQIVSKAGGQLRQATQQQGYPPQGYTQPGYAASGYAQPNPNQPSYGNPSYGQSAYGQPPRSNAGYRPQAAPSYQPPLHAGGDTIRIASYNIQVFGDSKASKPYVMETLAQVVQRFDIVAIQEIRTQNEYHIDGFLRDYVNREGRRYSRVVSERLGRTSSKEQYAYLFDTDTVEINPQVVFTMRDPQDRLHRQPYVAMFRTKRAPPEQAFSFILVNTHTDPDETDTELDALAAAYQQVRRLPIGEDDVILLGDLNTRVPASGPYTTERRGRALSKRDLRGLGDITGIYPLIRDQATNTVGSYLHDNLLVHRGATTEFTGRSGVLDVQRLMNLNQKQAVMVSDHLPVWGEFSIYESDVPGRIAGRAGSRR